MNKLRISPFRWLLYNSQVLCLALIGDVEGIFSSKYFVKAATSPEVLNWDTQTSKQHRKIAWHSRSAATPRGSVSHHLSSSRPAGITVNTRPPWTHLPLFYWASKGSQRYLITECETASTVFYKLSPNRVEALRYDCSNIKLRWTICQPVSH